MSPIYGHVEKVLPRPRPTSKISNILLEEGKMITTTSIIIQFEWKNDQPDAILSDYQLLRTIVWCVHHRCYSKQQSSLACS